MLHHCTTESLNEHAFPHRDTFPLSLPLSSSPSGSQHCLIIKIGTPSLMIRDESLSLA